MTREKADVGAYTIRLPVNLCEQLEAVAAKEGRPVAAVIRRFVEAHIPNGHMKLIVALDAPDWIEAAGGGNGMNVRVSSFARSLHTIADHLSACMGTGGQETTFEHGEVRGRYSLTGPGVKLPGRADAA
jgi:predicted DNA-binding protein